VAEIQAAHPEAVVETWSQDEARLGLQPILRRVWCRRGSRPRALVRPKRKWLYLYAFVHPLSGRSEWLILPRVRTDVMNLVLAEFARLSGAGRDKQIVLVWDNAGWHTSKELRLPEGMHVVALPAHTPELQPTERVWPLVREVVANQTLPDLDTLEERLATRCRWLAAQAEQIEHLTHFHWWPSC
jgi:transposase